MTRRPQIGNESKTDDATVAGKKRTARSETATSPAATKKGRHHQPSIAATEEPADRHHPTNTTLPARLSFPNDDDDDQKNHLIKLTTWNVNSLNAAMKKGFLDYVEAERADILCLQETKLQQAPAALPVALTKLYPHRYFFAGTRKKGYAGSAILSRVKPLQVWNGWEYAKELLEDDQEDWEDDEGRVMTAEYPTFFVCACYVPNAGQKLERLDWKCERWLPYLGRYLKALEKKKPVVWTGDLNVCRDAIDLARPKENYNKTAGYTQAEIDAMNAVIAEAGLVDYWRDRNPTLNVYTYFSYRFQCRQKHLGWRLDYCCVSAQMVDRVKDCCVREEVYGPSDHCPMTLFIEAKLEAD